MISSSPSSAPVELERRRVAAHDERRRDRLARRPGVVAREPDGVGGTAHVRQRRPDRASARVGDVLRIDRAAAARARARASASPRRAARSRATAPPGLTWSIVTGETPPQSSIPASSRRGKSSKARFGGACTCHAGPSRIRATAIVHRWSSSDGSGCEAMRVPGFARKFWTMTSWTWPCSSPSAFSASSASIRSSRVSPMPMRIPLVNGIASSPASRIVSSRRAGSLSGEAQCGPPLAPSRSAVVSSMIPIEAETGRSSSSSARVITPGFRCGSRPVSSRTSRAQRSRYSSVVSQPSARSSSRATL